MLPNASGLTWIDPQHLLFSEIRQGRHMAIVTSMENRNAEQDVWLPPREASVAHPSQVSPDGKWVLVVWMGTGAIGGRANEFPSKAARARDRLDQRTRPAPRPHDLRMGAGCISVRLLGEDSILLGDGGPQVRISGSQNYDRAMRLRSDAHEHRQQNHNSACVHVASLPGQSEINLHISGRLLFFIR
jgi:hypothetical protein